jgi:hypothetical protein
MLANAGDDLAEAVGGLLVLASGLMSHSEAIGAVVDGQLQQAGGAPAGQ